MNEYRFVFVKKNLWS